MIAPGIYTVFTITVLIVAADSIGLISRRFALSAYLLVMAWATVAYMERESWWGVITAGAGLYVANRLFNDPLGRGGRR